MYTNRSFYNGELRPEHCDQEVTVCGWVQRQRDLGSLIFVDLRDRTGIVQCVFGDTVSKDIFDTAFAVRSETVLCVTGKVRMRSNPNRNIPTGLVEILASDLQVLSRAQTPPFEIEDDTRVAELTRLEYRYLDLRRPRLQHNLMLRHKVMQAVRRFFDTNGFLEIETPILTKSTPEGARDYLVPSRLHEGRFYALPQSPQQYKQLLMVSGLDRYFQIARCMRDEDLRADRQPEFTQIDIEMSFVEMQDVLELNERMMASVFKEVLDVDIQLPMRRMPYREAIERYGSDKPDLRFGLELNDLTAVTRNCGFKVFEDAAYVGCIVVPDKFARKEIDKLTEFVKGLGVKGLAWHRAETSSFAKFIGDMTPILGTAGFKDGDLLLVIADSKPSLARSALGALRLECAKKLDIIDHSAFAFAWITEFPLFELDAESGQYIAQHHPFTSPMPEDIPLFEKGELDKCRARAYDMVLNGYELCSGSIRIHDSDIQTKMFELLGISQEEITSRFGHIIKAFSYGVPPHGGIAFGLDRIVMIMAGTDNIRDVIAFPKTQNAVEVMMDSPSDVDTKQLDELHIAIKK